MSGLEIRRAAELRTAGRQLVGYAATFNTRAAIGKAFTEVIRPGAFRATLQAGDDVLALIDHDTSKLLARTSSGTLRLHEDAKGLGFELDVPDTALGRDILTMVERRDVGGCSFAFHVTREAWPNMRQRELHSVQLREISIVNAWPAYSGTSVTARMRGQDTDAREQRRRFLATV